MFSKAWKFINGYKTQIVAILVGIGGALAYAGIAIPGFVWPLLAALGLAAVRDAVKKIEK